jgi:hypothetical protein
MVARSRHLEFHRDAEKSQMDEVFSLMTSCNSILGSREAAKAQCDGDHVAREDEALMRVIAGFTGPRTHQNQTSISDWSFSSTSKSKNRREKGNSPVGGAA